MAFRVCQHRTANRRPRSCYAPRLRADAAFGAASAQVLLDRFCHRPNVPDRLPQFVSRDAQFPGPVSNLVILIDVDAFPVAVAADVWVVSHDSSE